MSERNRGQPAVDVWFTPVGREDYNGLGFPAEDEVTVLLIGRHLRGARSIYQRLYRLLGIEEPTEERNKPPCCEDGESPVAPDLVQRVVDNAKRLRRS